MPCSPDIDLDDRPSPRAACLGCDQHRCLVGQLLCLGCGRRLGRLLEQLAAGEARLRAVDLAPVRRAGDGGRGAPGFGSRIPVRVDVLSLLLAPRDLSCALDSDNTRNAPLVIVVGAWADRAREHDVLPALRGPRYLAGEVLRLRGVLEQLAAQWWVGDMLADLSRAVARLERALGDDEPAAPLGRCPAPRPEYADEHLALVGDLGARLARRAVEQRPELVCGGMLRGGRDLATCRRCGRRWTGEAAVHELGRLLGDAMLDLGGLARYLELDPVKLRKWAQRDRWRREQAGRRTVYSLADARASARRAWERTHPVHGPELPPGWAPVALSVLTPTVDEHDDSGVVAA